MYVERIISPEVARFVNIQMMDWEFLHPNRSISLPEIAGASDCHLQSHY
jgi:hypothetical protein